MLPSSMKALDEHRKKALYDVAKNQFEDDNARYFDWARSRLVLLPKKGDSHNTSNMRGTSLLCT